MLNNFLISLCGFIITQNWFWKWFTRDMIVNLIHNSGTIYKSRNWRTTWWNILVHFCCTFFGTSFLAEYRRIKNIPHVVRVPARVQCGKSTGKIDSYELEALTMAPRPQWTQIARNHVSRRRAGFFDERSVDIYGVPNLPRNFALHCNFSLEKLCWKMFIYCTFLFSINFKTKYN